MYHVVIEVDPYDCMGSRVNDRMFWDLPSALAYYQSIFTQDSAVLPEIFDLYWPDQEHIEEATADDGNMVIDGKVYLLSSSIEIGTMKEVDGYEANTWINDYDELAKEGYATHLIDAYESVQAKTIIQYGFEFCYNEDIVSQCDKIQKICYESIIKNKGTSAINEVENVNESESLDQEIAEGMMQGFYQ